MNAAKLGRIKCIEASGVCADSVFEAEVATITASEALHPADLTVHRDHLWAPGSERALLSSVVKYPRLARIAHS